MNETGAPAPNDHQQSTQQSAAIKTGLRILSSHPFVWILQIGFWLLVIIASTFLLLFFADYFIICPLGSEKPGCVREDYLWRGLRLALLSLIPFFFAYVCRDKTPGSACDHFSHGVRSIGRIISRLWTDPQPGEGEVPGGGEGPDGGEREESTEELEDASKREVDKNEVTDQDLLALTNYLIELRDQEDPEILEEE